MDTTTIDTIVNPYQQNERAIANELHSGQTAIRTQHQNTLRQQKLYR